MAKISSTRIDMQSGRIDNAVLKAYGETLVGGTSGASSGTAYTVDISSGNVFHIFLTGNCTFTFSNPTASGTTCYFTLLLKQDGGSRTATWPSSVIWSGGSAPTLSTAGGGYDIVSFLTTDGGTNYIGFAGGLNFAAAAASTSYNLFAWGLNTSGQLGLVTDKLNRSVPTQVGTLSTWSVASVGRQFLSVRSDGTLWASGINQYGSLALGDVINRSSPTQVGGIITWSSVAVGTDFSHSIKTDGTLWAWGQNDYGQLGLGDTVKRSSPVQVGTLATWSILSAGGKHILAIQTSGTLWAWGYNANNGTLGLGDTAARSVPTQVGTLATWASAGSGAYHSAAIKTDDTLWVWGGGTHGRLGLGDTIKRSSPVQVGTLANWSTVDSGNRFTVATKTDGTLWIWGWGNNGYLGLGDIINRSSPVQVGTLATWSEVSAGNTFVQARKTDNTLWSWGFGGSGELGLGDVIYRSSPVQVGGGAGWAALGQSGVGGQNTLALQDPSLLANSQLFSWGRNDFGQLGLADTVKRSSPVQVGTLATWCNLGFTSVASAALKSDGTLWTWGQGSSGRLGLGDIIQRSSPVQVGALMDWSGISVGGAGQNHMAGIKINGTLWSWGLNGKGYLGLGDIISRSSPVQVGTLVTWSGVVAGSHHSVALKSDGTLWVWGSNANGNLGLGDGVHRSSPVQLGALTTWATVGAGTGSAFGIKTDGTLWAWGQNSTGYLGLGNVVYRSSPVQVGTLATWSKISGGRAHVVAVKTDGTLWAWGKNSDFGQLGLGDVVNRSSPVQIGTLTTWTSVSLGYQCTTAIKTDGTLWLWGNNNYGQAGQADAAVPRSSPVQVGTLSTWVLATADGQTNGLLWPPTTTTTVPGKPTAVIASVGSASGTAVVVWTAPMSSGGKPISLYTVTSSPGGITATTNGTFATVSGLTNGTAYTFTVTATNSVGTSSASAASNSVTPPVQAQLWTWGRNNTYGQLGLGDVVSRSSPVQVGTLSTWTSMSSTGVGPTSFGVKVDGTLWAWGFNTYGDLGLGDAGAATKRSSPVQVGTLATWAKVAAAEYRTFAIKTNGTLWSWGWNAGNSSGALGLGDAVSRSSPVQVGTLGTWSTLGAGQYSAFSFKTDGTLWVWGKNSKGELGLADIISRSSPVQVGTLATWSSAASDAQKASLLLKTDGTLWAMGENAKGQLGLNNAVLRSSPVQIGTLGTWSQIAQTMYSGFALKTDGTIWAWGYNQKGQLGLGDAVYRSSPVQVGTLATWRTLSAAGHNALAVKTDGTLWTWGENGAGYLGLSDIVNRSSPVQVGTLATWLLASGGKQFSFGLR